MIIEENKDLDYWKRNAEEDYMQVPISVLRYISELEEAVKNCFIPPVVGQSEQFICHSCNTKHSGKNDDQLYEVCKDCFNSI